MVSWESHGYRLRRLLHALQITELGSSSAQASWASHPSGVIELVSGSFGEGKTLTYLSVRHWTLLDWPNTHSSHLHDILWNWNARCIPNRDLLTSSFTLAPIQCVLYLQMIKKGKVTISQSLCRTCHAFNLYRILRAKLEPKTFDGSACDNQRFRLTAHTPSSL